MSIDLLKIIFEYPKAGKRLIILILRFSTLDKIIKVKILVLIQHLAGKWGKESFPGEHGTGWKSKQLLNENWNVSLINN